MFDFPEGIGPITCVNVEHEEVVLIPRWIDAGRVTFKYGLGEEFIDVLRTLHKLGLDRTAPVDGARHQGQPPRPRRGLPAEPGRTRRPDERPHLRRHAASPGRARRPARSSYLYQVVDNAWTMAEYGHQAVVWQTALNPVVALELLAAGRGQGVGVLGPEAFDAVPYLACSREYGAPWCLDERQALRAVA